MSNMAMLSLLLAAAMIACASAQVSDEEEASMQELLNALQKRGRSTLVRFGKRNADLKKNVDRDNYAFFGKRSDRSQLVRFGKRSSIMPDLSLFGDINSDGQKPRFG